MGTLVFQATLGGAINIIGPNTASTVNFTLPSADGSSGQALSTNGSGTLSFGTLAVGAGGTGQTSYTNGQLLIGNTTGNTLTKATLTAGSGVTITNGSGAITIAATGAASQWTTTGSDIYYTTGNVGIGTSSPVSALQVAKNYTNTSDTNIVVSGNIPGINIRPATGRFSILASYASGDTTSFIVGTGTSNPSSEVIRLDHTNSTTAFTNSISVGGATPTTSGSGITFPASQAASSNANTLDDYEEGTWTPTTPNNGYVFSTVSGKYTKIGNVVYISFTVVFSTIGSTNSACVFQGLPFAKGTAGTGACREGSTTGAIYMVASSGSTNVELNSMDGVANGTNRTIRVSEEYICSYFYYV